MLGNLLDNACKWARSRVAVTSAPWLLTTTVLMSLRVLARHQGALAFRSIEHLLTVVLQLGPRGCRVGTPQLNVIGVVLAHAREPVQAFRAGRRGRG